MQEIINYEQNCADLLDNLFITRKDTYAKQRLLGDKKAFSRIDATLSKDILVQHINGDISIGGYQLEKNNNVKYGAWDFDENTPEDFERAKKLFKYLKEKGFNPMFEFSGGGQWKCHIFIFSKESIPAKQMKSFLEKESKESGVQAHEIFPKQEKLTENGYGNFVKLPLGFHCVTKKYSTLADDEFNPITNNTKILEKLEYHANNKSIIPGYQSKEDEQKEIDNKSKNFDVFNNCKHNRFFSYCLNNDLPKGISIPSEIGNNEAGINNNILKNMAISLVRIGYTLEEIEKNIRDNIWKNNPTRYNNLKGWFVKAISGDITEVSTGELVEWCKIYAPDLIQLLDLKQFLREGDLKYNTSHMKHFNELDKVLALMGNEYSLFKKMVHYTMVSLATPTSLKICKIGNIKIDTRFHPAFCVPSGKGKKNIKECVKKIYVEYCPHGNVNEPRVIHKEQLIGKVLKRKEKDETGRPRDVYIKKYGYLNSDLIFFEEAHEIFNSSEKNDVDCRDSITVALDLYGENLIQKQNIDNLNNEEETIKYYPHGNALFFFQPLRIREEFSIKGLQRRLIICFVEFPEKTHLSFFEDRLLSKQSSEESIKCFAEYMRKINSVSGEWSMETDAIEEFKNLHYTLLQQGFLQGGKKYHFTKILEFPMQDLLLKFSCLRALSNFRTNITKGDIQEAFIDLIEKFTHELIFVEKIIKGTLDYGNSWNGATGKSQECLQWLLERRAFSKKESEVSINEFQKIISQKYDISERRARDRYNKMKSNNLIQDWRGQGSENKVWLRFKPKIKNQNEKVDNKFSPRGRYFSLIKNRGWKNE